MPKIHAWAAPALALLATAACGSALQPPHTLVPPAPPPLPAAARHQFDEAIAAMAAHDRANDWTPASCSAAARAFIATADAADPRQAAPSYDAALAYQRCGMHAEAKTELARALARDPGFHRARTMLALYAFTDSRGKQVERAIAEVSRSVSDARYQSVGALVALAMLQMHRADTRADADGADDFERARRNLQRALAIDAGSMPAMNQLALHHLAVAKRRAVRATDKVGTAGARPGAQELELALLVCSQGTRRSPDYAPLHNTTGLVAVALEDFTLAAREFARARELDPRSFEAHMNFGAVNLQFRGFALAEQAFRSALALDPRDYDARLGLALAIRGQIDAPTLERRFALADAELAAARKIDANRPEAYFNDARLTLAFGAKVSGDPDAALAEARSLFEAFLVRARRTPGLADSVREAELYLVEIEQARSFSAATDAAAAPPAP
jgi:tetratricopeptide (TPR) repeat protein